jgi:hypothetical protein
VPAGDGDVERQQDDGRGVDGHRRRDLVEGDAIEQGSHVFDGIDGDAHLADLARGKRVVGVVADLRREVERDAEAHHPLRQEVAVAAVGFGGCRESRVLPHRPRTAAVHRGLYAAREGEGAGLADVGSRVGACEVVGGSEKAGLGAGRHAVAAILRSNAPVS